MSTTIQFVLLALTLTLGPLALLFYPLWRPARSVAEVDRRQLNLSVFRDQLKELENDRDSGLLAGEDFESAKRELQRRLLDEVDTATEGATVRPGTAGRRVALVFALLIPLSAALLYARIGNWQALEASPAAGHMASQDLDVALAKLVDRLKANPDDHKGWVILARSYKALGRFDEAIEAYGRGGPVVNEDAYLLADYAEALVQANDGQFTAKADALIARALTLDPNSMLALFLAGHSANDRQDFAAAIRFWERLLPQLDPKSEDHEFISAAIDKTRAASGKPAKAREAASATRDLSISGEVVLSGKLAAKAQPEDTLYVFARAAEGSRMPIAVVRARVADLPFTYRLDDRNSLPGGQKLSAAQSVVIEARITKGGMAQSTSGDLFGVLKNIKPGASKQRLVIDQVQP